MSLVELHFGGPDLAPGRLRDLLAERVAAVPPGGRIDWVTYYFRDRRLAEDLVRAHARGVRVRLTLDGRPRCAAANAAVSSRLAQALGPGLRVSASPLDRLVFTRPWRPRLHEKLYCFSHPLPHALVGSFNPSGDEPEQEPAVRGEIGDQDRGHNLLAELRDPALALALARHAEQVHRAPHSALERFLPRQNRALRSGDVSVHLRPRATRDPLLRLLDGCGPGARVRLTASHLSGRTGPAALLAAARRGARVEILAEATERRVPPRVEQTLAAGGVWIRRLREAGGVPMHLKLVLFESAGERCAAFGSFNWTENSLRLNREIVVLTREAAVFETLAQRFEQLRQRATAPPAR